MAHHRKEIGGRTEPGHRQDLLEILVRFFQFKFFRFASVGAINGLIYAAATAISISGFELNDKLASAIGYMTALPFAFFAHRSYTFVSHGRIDNEFSRFLITHTTSLLVSVFAMGIAVDFLNLHYSVGIFGAIVLVPIATYIAMDGWVFANQLVKDSKK